MLKILVRAQSRTAKDKQGFELACVMISNSSLFAVGWTTYNLEYGIWKLYNTEFWNCAKRIYRIG